MTSNYSNYKWNSCLSKPSHEKIVNLEVENSKSHENRRLVNEMMNRRRTNWLMLITMRSNHRWARAPNHSQWGRSNPTEVMMKPHRTCISSRMSFSQVQSRIVHSSRPSMIMKLRHSYQRWFKFLTHRSHRTWWIWVPRWKWTVWISAQTCAETCEAPTPRFHLIETDFQTGLPLKHHCISWATNLRWPLGTARAYLWKPSASITLDSTAKKWTTVEPTTQQLMLTHQSQVKSARHLSTANDGWYKTIKDN